MRISTAQPKRKGLLTTIISDSPSPAVLGISSKYWVGGIDPAHPNPKQAIAVIAGITFKIDFFIHFFSLKTSLIEKRKISLI
jgi:hypothetical protein